MDSAIFVLKVLIGSTAIAIAVKYGAPFLEIPMTSITALVAVLLPSTVMAVILAIRSRPM